MNDDGIARASDHRGIASLPAWSWAVLAVAALEILLGWSGLLADLVAPFAEPATGALLFLLIGAAFAVPALVLLIGARGGAGAASLGSVYLLVASGFADSGVESLTGRLTGGAELAVTAFTHLQVEAFGAYFFWRFACRFPFDPRAAGAPSHAGARSGDLLRRLALGVGGLLVAVNVALFLEPAPGAGATARSGLALFDRRQPASHYWSALFVLVLAALAFLVWRAMRMPAAERGRVVLFVVALVVGFLPLTVAVLAEVLVPAVGDLLQSPRADRWARALVYPPLLAVPILTAYSVIVDRVLEVRLITRQALAYALARYAVLLAPWLPFSALLVTLYLERNLTVRGLFSEPAMPLVVASALAAVLAFALRRRLLAAVDGRFLRAPYESQAVLSSLVERVREAASGEQLEELVRAELERALHPRSVALLLHEPLRGRFERPGRRQPVLDAASSLARALSAHQESIELDGDGWERLGPEIAPADREWLARSELGMLVPILAGDGGLLGIIGLGRKRSELPYDSVDRRLLKAVAAAVALSLENRLLAASPRPRETIRPPPPDSAADTLDDTVRPPAPAASRAGGDDGAEIASECRECGHVQPGGPPCDLCGGPLERGFLPHVLLDKFRLEQRIGAGSMGVVYRARDLVLGREVAIKALPRVTPRHASRLRREAQVVAAIAHPNLALIYGAELWGGMPLLVFELLRGGTLADRLKRGPLEVETALRIGCALCATLQAIHHAGILHRDIKPSNIGFTTTEVPKLLDFGLAVLVSEPHELAGGSPTASPLGPGAVALSTTAELDELTATPPSPIDRWRRRESSDPLVAFSITDQVVGTPLYLSPEAVRHQPPTPLVDLWSLSLVLYEAIAGRNPMRRKTVVATLRALLHVDVPDLRTLRPDAPAEVAELFREALAHDPRLRPQSAAELGERLERLAG